MSRPNGEPEELVESSETVEQLVNQCDEFFVNEPEEQVEELIEPTQTVEQLLAQADEFIL